MKDAIDKRNEREKIANSIVKRWNVVYITKEELERKRQEEERMARMEEEREKADDILRRLDAEAEADKRKKAEELQALIYQKEIEGHKSQDTYGTTPMDGVTQEKVEAILSDKERMLQELIQNTEVVSTQPKMEEGLGEELAADNAATEMETETEPSQDASEIDQEAEKDLSEN